MATLIAAGDHNFTAASWGTVDATSLLVSSTNNTGLTSTYVLSSTFTPGAIEIDGIAVWIATRNATPSGTISIALDQATVTVAGTEVTINVADIPAFPTLGNCWVFFKFAAPVTLLAATAYSVKAKTSVASGQVTLNRNATANNWARLLRTTTLAAPGAGDDLYVLGEKTGSGTGNTITVTMDNTDSTTFGLCDVNSGGFLIYGTAGATNFNLKLGGNLNIRSGGEVNIGTTSVRIPSTSTAELQFANSANVDFGIEFTGNGILRTGGDHNANPWALLDADASAGATSLTTDRTTGWKNGDTIAIAPTTRNADEAESKALTADAGGTSLTIAALTNAHGGDASTLVQAELVNLTRNVKIHGAASNLQAYINTSAASVCDLNDTEIYFLGSNTSNKRGINLNCTTGSFSADYCSFHSFLVASSLILGASAMNHVLLTHAVFYNHAGFPSPDFGSVTSGSDIVISDCVFIRTSTNGSGASIGIRFCWNHQLSDLRLAGCRSHGLQVSGGAFNGTLDNIVTHSHGSIQGGSGLLLGSFTAGSNPAINNLTAWRCNTTGFSAGIEINARLSGVTINGLTAFGSGGRNVIINNNDPSGLTIVGADIRAGTGQVCPVGLELHNESSFRITGLIFLDSVFGGGGQTHSTGDIEINVFTADTIINGFLLDNCVLNSSVQVASQTRIRIVEGGTVESAIRANFLGQTQNHKTWLGSGTWSYDTVIADSSPSLRMTPLSASLKLQSPGFKKGVQSGQSATVSIKVRTSVVGDGAAYNGAQVRLFVRRNYGAGITSDTLLDTSTAAADGAFETLSGTTAAVSNNCVLEFYLDCDGTAGWVNVDTFTASAA